MPPVKSLLHNLISVIRQLNTVYFKNYENHLCYKHTWRNFSGILQLRNVFLQRCVMVMHDYNSSIWNTEARQPQVQSQPGKHS